MYTCGNWGRNGRQIKSNENKGLSVGNVHVRCLSISGVSCVGMSLHNVDSRRRTGKHNNRGKSAAYSGRCKGHVDSAVYRRQERRCAKKDGGRLRTSGCFSLALSVSSYPLCSGLLLLLPNGHTPSTDGAFMLPSQGSRLSTAVGAPTL